jgi:hypothetical protein
MTGGCIMQMMCERALQFSFYISIELEYTRMKRVMINIAI